MNSPGFAVAMATYNGERFLREQLESLARQTLLPRELVVCDDLSTDETVSILEAFAARAPFDVRIYRNERNLGFGDNFLRAISLCETEWIALCDQDDVWLEEKLERCAEIIARHPEISLLTHSAMQVDEQLRPLKHRIPDYREFEIKDSFTNPPLKALLGCTCCVRKSLLAGVPYQVRPYDFTLRGERSMPLQGHDRFIYHIANTFGKIAYSPETLALYRRHGAAVTGAAGTGVYTRGLIYKAKVRLYASSAYFLTLAEDANQHKAFYEAAAEEAIGCNSGFRRKSLEACGYYAFLNAAFARRADIYRKGSRLPDRVSAYRDLIRMGAYVEGGVRRTLGRFAAVRDAFGVLSSL